MYAIRSYYGVAALRQRGGPGTDHDQRELVFREDLFLQDSPYVACANVAEKRDWLLGLDQRAGLLYCFRNFVAVILADQLDLLTVNSASGVDRIEIELRAGADMVACRCEQSYNFV